MNKDIHKAGVNTQFGKGLDPVENGRKGGQSKDLVKHMKEELNIELGEKFTESSILDAIALIMTTPIEDLKRWKNDDRIVAVLSVYINAIVQDRDKGRTSTTEELLNRIYGKAKENVNVTTEMTYEEALKRKQQLDDLRKRNNS